MAKEIPDKAFFITLFFGISFAYFLWLSWKKLTEVIGSTNIVWGIMGGIVIIGIVTGTFGFRKLAERFK